MSCLEIVVLILVCGFVSMIEICALMICAGKVFDAKLKTKVEMELKIFETEMERFDKTLDKLMTRVESCISKKEE